MQMETETSPKDGIVRVSLLPRKNRAGAAKGEPRPGKSLSITGYRPL